MEHILLLFGAVTLLTTSGCLVAETGRYGHEHHGYHEYHEHRSAVIVGPPVIVVRPPEVIIR